MLISIRSEHAIDEYHMGNGQCRQADKDDLQTGSVNTDKPASSSRATAAMAHVAPVKPAVMPQTGRSRAFSAWLMRRTCRGVWTSVK